MSLVRYCKSIDISLWCVPIIVLLLVWYAQSPVWYGYCHYSSVMLQEY